MQHVGDSVAAAWSLAQQSDSAGAVWLQQSPQSCDPDWKHACSEAGTENKKTARVISIAIGADLEVDALPPWFMVEGYPHINSLSKPPSLWWARTGAPGGTRTCYLQFRKLSLCPGELRGHLAERYKTAAAVLAMQNQTEAFSFT